MAIRARRYQDARAQARTNIELGWWVFTRLSGLFLVVLTVFHVFSQYIVRSELDATYAYVVVRYASLTERLYLFALLTLGGLHGANGVRYVIDDATARNPRARLWAKSLFYTVVVAVLTFGTLALFVGSQRIYPIPGVDR